VGKKKKGKIAEWAPPGPETQTPEEKVPSKLRGEQSLAGTKWEKTDQKKLKENLEERRPRRPERTP